MRVKSYSINREKLWKVVCYGKIISKHIDFYNAQSAVERYLKNDKIDNSYEILPIKQ